MKQSLKTRIKATLWLGAWGVALLLSILIITIPLTWKIMQISGRNAMYYASILRYGEDAKLSRVIIEDEGSKGTYYRETDNYLLTSKGERKLFTEEELKSDGNLDLFRRFSIKKKLLGKEIMSNKEYKKYLIGG